MDADNVIVTTVGSLTVIVLCIERIVVAIRSRTREGCRSHPEDAPVNSPAKGQGTA
jgi:hypothetical protein